MSNVFCVKVITHPATKDAPSTKTYKREPSQPYETKRPKKNQDVPSQIQLQPGIFYATTLKSQTNQYETATPHIHQQTYQQQPQMPISDIQEMKVMMKGLMLSFLSTLVSKMA